MTTSNCRPSPRPGRCLEHEANDILRREFDWASARFAGDDDQHFELSHAYQELRAHSSITSQSERAADAAERFDRSVNAVNYRPKLRWLRFVGLSRS
jgi:hypothetical protein